MDETTADTPTAAPPVRHSDLFHRVQDRLVARGHGSLALFIAVRRAETPPRPYRKIATELTALTEIDMTHEAPRRWHVGVTKRAAPQAVAA